MKPAETLLWVWNRLSIGSRRLTSVGAAACGLLGCVSAFAASDGYWSITQTPFQNVLQPAINNSGEIVWCLNAGGGVFSSVRGQLASSGLYPHLANSGEVVYATHFEGSSYWDLVSTTRGRLTYGGIIDVNASTFDVNSSGEVVYAKRDSTGYQQIYSTVRGQLTSDPANHYNPCINDNGEVVWAQNVPDLGSRTVSSTRGILPESYGFAPLDLNNLGEICFSQSLYSPTAQYTFPHIGSSTHGVIIDNPDLYQWNGSLNDAGTIVWDAPAQPGSSTWYVYEAQWVPEPSVNSLLVLGLALAGFCRWTAARSP